MMSFAVNIWNKIEKLVYVVLGWLFKIVHKELSDAAFKSFMQFIKFGIVGVSNTLVAYTIYAVTLIILRHLNVLIKFDFLIAQVVSFMLSVLWSYFWNSRMVFTVEEGKHRNKYFTLFKTYVSYSFTGLFLNSFLLVLFINVFHVSAFVAPVVNLFVNVPINFLLNKFWAYKQS